MNKKELARYLLKLGFTKDRDIYYFDNQNLEVYIADTPKKCSIFYKERYTSYFKSTYYTTFSNYDKVYYIIMQILTDYGIKKEIRDNTGFWGC